MQNGTMPKAHEVKTVEQTTCCIVGGGPAGVMLALLLARQGVAVSLLEAHSNFDREFRGDTVHPSVLNILDEIGLTDRLLQLRHTKMRTMSAQTTGGTFTFANFGFLKTRTKFPYIAMIPQVDFLNFIVNEAKRYPEFHLLMEAQVDELIEEAGRIVGVRYRGKDGRYEMRAVLTVATDGRFSRLRKLAGFEPIKTSPPMDILWFCLTRKSSDAEMTFAHFGQQHVLAMLNRDDHWQLGYVIPKGQYQQIHAAGLENLRQSIAGMVPELADRVQELQDWKQVSVLSVESSLLPCWHRPGLLLIGDAAHVMSPIGGVGINYAIQDAVVAANVLGGKLKYGVVSDPDLAKIQRQRELPTRFIQAFQSFLQKNIFQKALRADQPFSLPLIIRMLARVPLLKNLPGRIIAFGLWPAHVTTVASSSCMEHHATDETGASSLMK